MATARSLSLRWLVPAISALILTVVVLVFGTVAYRSVERSTLDAAAKRLSTVAQVFAQPSLQQPVWIRDAMALARTRGVIEIVRSSGRTVGDSARARIARLTPDTGQTLATDVRAADGTILYSITSPLAESLAMRSPDDHAIALLTADSVSLTAASDGWPTPIRIPQSRVNCSWAGIMCSMSALCPSGTAGD